VSGSGDRRRALLAKIVDPSGVFETQRLCDVCAEVTGVTGAGVMLMSGDVPRGSVCTTDAVSSLIEELRGEPAGLGGHLRSPSRIGEQQGQRFDHGVGIVVVHDDPGPAGEQLDGVRECRGDHRSSGRDGVDQHARRRLVA